MLLIELWRVNVIENGFRNRERGRVVEISERVNPGRRQIRVPIAAGEIDQPPASSCLDSRNAGLSKISRKNPAPSRKYTPSRLIKQALGKVRFAQSCGFNGLAGPYRNFTVLLGINETNTSAHVRQIAHFARPALFYPIRTRPCRSGSPPPCARPRPLPSHHAPGESRPL